MSIKKRIESKLIPRVLIWALGRMDLTFTEIGEIERNRFGQGRKVFVNSDLDMIKFEVAIKHPYEDRCRQRDKCI